TGGLIIIVPGAFLAALLLTGGSAAWAWLFLALVLIGFVVAGYVAGRLRDDTPIIHGAVSALIAFVVAQAFGIATTAARGGSISWVTIPLTALLAISMGVVGSLVSDRVRRRQARLA
ncbi:MAG: hypothetical protein ACRBK7_33110, partial [Acidimicrobiales bacterium]